jgi:phenylpropionate dioxygenase-like ring-hydroxylating dioxygenase large terminal subunit
MTSHVPARWRLGPSTVPKSRYLDSEYLQIELDRLFTKTWLVACREEEVAAAGSYVVFDIGDHSLIIVRTRAGDLEALHNSCRHRGSRIVEERGRIGELRCPFHAWRWELDGTFKHRLDDASFEPVEAATLCLPRCSIATWGGFVFISLDPNAEPLEDYLAPLPERLDGFRLEDMRYVWHKSFELEGNWKTAIDAFVEAYHTPGTHPQYLRPTLTPATAAGIAESELWPPALTESHGLHGRCRKAAPTPDEPAEIAERRAAATGDPLLLMLHTSEYHLAQLGSLNPWWDHEAAKRTIALPDLPGEPFQRQLRFFEMRRAVAAEAGIALPHLTPEQVRRGAYDWHIFPNTILLVTGVVGCLLGYRVLPDRSDPERCTFDVFALELPGSDGPPAVNHEHFDDWQSSGLGEVLSQDFDNIARVTRGMRSPTFHALHLNTRQESTISHYHAVADRYMFSEKQRAD